MNTTASLFLFYFLTLAPDLETLFPVETDLAVVVPFLGLSEHSVTSDLGGCTDPADFFDVDAWNNIILLGEMAKMSNKKEKGGKI